MRDGVTFLVYERLNYFPRFSRRAQNHGACQLAELDNPTMEGCSPLPRVEMPLVPSFEPSLAMPPNIFTDTSCYDIETGLDLVDTPCTGTWFRFRLTVSKYLPSARSDSTEDSHEPSSDEPSVPTNSRLRSTRSALVSWADAPEAAPILQSVTRSSFRSRAGIEVSSVPLSPCGSLSPASTTQ